MNDKNVHVTKATGFTGDKLNCKGVLHIFLIQRYSAFSMCHQMVHDGVMPSQHTLQFWTIAWGHAKRYSLVIGKIINSHQKLVVFTSYVIIKALRLCYSHTIHAMLISLVIKVHLLRPRGLLASPGSPLIDLHYFVRLCQVGSLGWGFGGTMSGWRDFLSRKPRDQKSKIATRTGRPHPQPLYHSASMSASSNHFLNLKWRIHI